MTTSHVRVAQRSDPQRGRVDIVPHAVVLVGVSLRVCRRGGFGELEFGLSENTAPCQRIQNERGPVSPSGIRFTLPLKIFATVSNTCFESDSGTLPRRST